MLLQELLTSAAGLMSLAVVSVTIGIGVYAYFRLRAYIRAEARQRGESER